MERTETFRRNPDRFDWRGFGRVAALAFVVAASFQGSRGLYESTEGRYAECARETLASGDWDDPILNGRPHWTKPPLTYMAIMAGTRVLGNNPWGVRAYLVVAMVLAATGTWWAGRVIWGPGAGRWAGVVFATSPVMAGAAHVASADMLTVQWVALATAAFWHGAVRRSTWAWLATWVFLGLALLTKGPPALLVPMVSMPVAWGVMRRDGAGKIDRWIAWAGLALFLLVGVAWFACEAWLTPGLLSYWIGDELIGRNILDKFDRDRGFAFVLTDYLPTMLLGAGPWIPLILWRGRPIKKVWRPDPRAPLSARAARASLAAGVAIPFAVFALSKSKMPLYVAPLFVPLCLGLGRAIDVLVEQGRLRKRTAGIWAGGLLALIVAVKGGLAHVDRPKDMTRLAAVLEPALARDGTPELYTVSRMPRNGLEFHLDRLIENVPAQSFPAHVAGRVAAGRSVAYLVGKAEWARLSTNVPVSVRPEELGRHWLLIRVPADP